MRFCRGGLPVLLKKLEVGPFKTNCYLVADPETGDCTVIDPGADVHAILDALDEEHFTLRAVLLTHAHFDHFGAMWPLQMRRPAPVYVNERDLAPIVNTGPYRFVPPEDTHFVSEGDEIRVRAMCFRVLECPGHTPGGVSYICEDMLFSGDTLLHMDCGCWVSACANPEDLVSSLGKLRDLPGDYRLFPGHGKESTLSYERAENPYLKPGLELYGPEEDEEDYLNPHAI